MRPGQRLPFRRDEAGEARGVDRERRDRLVRVWRAALPAVVRLRHVHGEDMDLVEVDDRPRRRVRRAPREALDGHDGAGGGAVEGEAPSQVVGGVEPAVLDPRPGLDGREPFLDQPPALVPPGDAGRVLRVGPALGGQQQPVERLLAVRRVGFQHPHGEHAQGRRAFRRVGRRDQVDEPGPQLEAIGTIGRDGLAEIEPELSEGLEAAVVIKGQARVRSPGRLGRVLADKARRLGANFMQADVTGIQRMDSGWEIQCAGGTLEADRLVVCLGAWSPGFLEWTNLNVPLMAERGYHVEFSEPGIEIYNSVMDVDAKVVASSMEGGVSIAGLAEFAPIDAPPDARRKARLVQVAKAAFRGLKTDRPSSWMGRRPSFPDSLPMLGDVPGHQGLFLNFGHAHYGLMMAPKSGELIAEMICGEETSHKINDFSPSRFCR